MWADQKGRGTHVNLSGFGVVRASDRAAAATELLEFLSEPREQELFARNNFEFPVAPGVKPAPELARFGEFKRDPIDVARAGRRLDDAVKLMNEAGWE